MAKQNLITHQINGVSVLQRKSDGFFNATAMCKGEGKLIADYLRLGNTKDFIGHLGSDMGIPISSLVQAVRGGKSAQGTWVSPNVAMHLAQWLSPEFAVQVTKLVLSQMSGGTPPPPKLPAKPKALPANNYYTLQKWEGQALVSSEVVTLPVLQTLIDTHYSSSALMKRADLLNLQKNVRAIAHQAASSISQVLQPIELNLLSGNGQGSAANQALESAMASFPR